MRLARRDPHRDQQASGLAKYPLIPTLTPSNAGGPSLFHDWCAWPRRSQLRAWRGLHFSADAWAKLRSTTGVGVAATTVSHIIIQSAEAVALRLGQRAKSRKEKSEPAFGVRVLSVASHRFPPMIDAQKAPSSPKRKARTMVRAPLHPPRGALFAPGAQAEPELEAR